MGKRTFDEEFEYVANSKSINEKYFQMIKEQFESVISGNSEMDYDFFLNFSHYDNFIMTGDTYLIQTAVLIIMNEERVLNRSYFFEKIYEFETAKNKMRYLMLLLRRIEIAPEDNFSEEAYNYILNENISIESIITLLKRGCFEWESKICTNIYMHNASYFSDTKKIEWLYILKETYHDDYILLVLAQLQIKYKQLKEARCTLNEVRIQNNLVKSLVREVEILLNE